MNNNNAAAVGGEEHSLLAPPDATELVYTQVSFDGHHQTATDSVVPASAPATAAASSVGNGTALTTFSAVRGAGSDGGGGRGEYVQIDLERTEALRRTAEENHRTEREGERRPRHNSTLGEFLKDAVKRNSAS